MATSAAQTFTNTASPASPLLQVELPKTDKTTNLICKEEAILLEKIKVKYKL